MRNQPDPIPAALYARVSSERQDVDLSVAAQLRALRNYARPARLCRGPRVRRRGRKRPCRQPAGVPQDAGCRWPSPGALPGDPSLEVLALYPQARTCRGLQGHVAAQGHPSRLHYGARRRLAHRQADGSHHRERGRVLLREPGPGGHPRHARSGLPAAFGCPAACPTAIPACWCRTARRSAPSWRWWSRPAGVVRRLFALADRGQSLLDITRTLNDEGIASPHGKRWLKSAVHRVLTNEVYTGTLVWGLRAKDQAPPVRVPRAFPAIVSRAEFRRVATLLASRGPTKVHPRRSASSYLLSGLVKCRRCGPGALRAGGQGRAVRLLRLPVAAAPGERCLRRPRLNARRFEGLIVEQIRDSILTADNLRALVRLVDAELDGVAHEQRRKLTGIETELAEVQRRLDRVWHVIETSDLELADATERIKAHRARQERLEQAADETRARLSAGRGGAGQRADRYGLYPRPARLSADKRPHGVQGLHPVLRQGDCRGPGRGHHSLRDPPAN